eukprot:scaffold3138_cov128-Pinguiococcus_pyrenoidosus.AAC.2
MLASSQGSEAKYIVRALQGRLRIGCSERTVIRALAYAVAQSQDLLPEEATPVEGALPLITEAIQLRDAKKLTVDERCGLSAEVVTQAFSECPSYQALCDALLGGPLWAVQYRCHLRPGLPVLPMLAKPTKKITEVLERLRGQ